MTQSKLLEINGLTKPTDKRRWRHGMTRTPLHKVWMGMMGRCYTKTKSKYHRYGARGIGVCDEWRFNFVAFYRWATSNGYRSGLQINRINNDGNYDPSNCNFVTNLENAQNRPQFQRSPELVRSVLASLKINPNVCQAARQYGVGRKVI